MGIKLLKEEDWPGRQTSLEGIREEGFSMQNETNPFDWRTRRGRGEDRQMQGTTGMKGACPPI
jgi:hypothetical protein